MPIHKTHYISNDGELTEVDIMVQRKEQSFSGTIEDLADYLRDENEWAEDCFNGGGLESLLHELGGYDEVVETNTLIQEIVDRLTAKRDEDKLPPFERYSYSYLGATGRGDIACEYRSFAKYKRGLMLYAVKAMCDQYQTDCVYNVSEWGSKEVAPQFVDVSTSATEKVNCPSRAYVHLKKDDHHLVLMVEATSATRPPSFNVFSNKNETAYARDLAREIESYMKEHNFYKGHLLLAEPEGYLSFIVQNGRSWDDVIIPEDIKQEIIQNVVWPITKREAFTKNGIPTKRGVMFEGPPGVGKTMVASAIANELDGLCTTIWVTPKAVSSMDAISVLYEMAREMAPSIVLFEDLDLLAPDRSLGSSPILGELLAELDGLTVNENIVTLASSNYPEAIEKALRDRPSRFDRRIKFDKPNEEERYKMLTIFTKSITKDVDVDLKALAKLSEGMTGAYLRELVSSATIEALKENPDKEEFLVNGKHFAAALEKLKTKGERFGFHLE